MDRYPGGVNATKQNGVQISAAKWAELRTLPCSEIRQAQEDGRHNLSQVGVVRSTLSLNLGRRFLGGGRDRGRLDGEHQHHQGSRVPSTGPLQLPATP